MCPRAGYEGTSISAQRPGPAETGEIGPFQGIIVARARDEEIRRNGQYGGVTSALLIYALEKGHIKSAVLTDKGGHRLSPGGRIARNRAEILSCAGSRYSASASLSALNKAVKAGEDKLGVVGVPCQMEALGRMRLIEPDGEESSSRVALKIGLFCTWAIDYRQLEAFLKREGEEGSVIKFDIPPPPSEKFQVQTEKGWRDFSLSDIRVLVQEGCAFCQDMTAEWADVSIGMVEGREGWNTVVLRTDTGAGLVNEAIKERWLETGHLPEENLEHLKEAAHNKRERGKKAGRDMGPE